MRTTIKQASLAAVAALALVAGGTGSALAAHGGHFGGGHFGGFHGGFHGFHGGGFGPGFVGGLALGAIAGAPYYGYGYDDYAYEPYAYDYGPDCYLTRRVTFDQWGRRIIRRVQVCD